MPAFVESKGKDYEKWLRRLTLDYDKVFLPDLDNEELRTVVLSDAFPHYTDHDADHLKRLPSLKHIERYKVLLYVDHGAQQLSQDAQPERVVVSEEQLRQDQPLGSPLDGLRHFLQIRFSMLYSQVLEPTLADLYLEHSAALAEGHPLKAWRVLLQGYSALAAAAVCQLGVSLLGRIKALWKTRSPK